MAKTPPEVGSITWTDLTVEDAESIRDFYESVVGWTSTPLDMNGYADYVMKSSDSKKDIAGICHSRGVNAGLPAQWLVYITVANLEASLKACQERGGQVIHKSGTFAVIKDPAGAACALSQQPKEQKEE